MELQQIVNDLRGFGIQDIEEPLVIKIGDQTLSVVLSNIPTEVEIQALLAGEGYKDQAWARRVRCEIISRSVSKLNGVDLKQLKGVDRLVVDPTDNEKKDVLVVLRNLMLGWGYELVCALWNALCTHVSNTEKHILEQMPEAAVATEFERRFLDEVYANLQEEQEELIVDTVEEISKEGKGSEEIKSST